MPVHGVRFIFLSTQERTGKVFIVLFFWGKSLACMTTKQKLLLLNAVEIKIGSLSLWEQNLQWAFESYQY